MNLCVLRFSIMSLVLISGSVYCGPQNKVKEAEQVVRQMVDSVLHTLRDQELAADRKMEVIMNTIQPVFDFPLMGKLTLGRHYWPKLDESQQSSFTDLFVQKLQNVYTDKIKNFRDEKVNFEEAQEVNGKVYVPTHIVSKSDRISLLYKLYRSEDSWRIYDVEIQDVSIISSYRSQFIPIIRDRSTEALLDEMRANFGASADKGD